MGSAVHLYGTRDIGIGIVTAHILLTNPHDYEQALAFVDKTASTRSGYHQKVCRHLTRPKLVSLLEYGL